MPPFKERSDFNTMNGWAIFTELLNPKAKCQLPSKAVDPQSDMPLNVRRLYCRGPLCRLCMGISERSGAVESWRWMGLSCIKSSVLPAQVGGFSHCASLSRLQALHSCPHATVHWSPMGGGTRQYIGSCCKNLLKRCLKAFGLKA